MRVKLENKKMLIPILFASFFFISCQSLNLIDMEPGNINTIYSEVTLSGDQIYLHNKISRRVDYEQEGVLRFYLPSNQAMTNLAISNKYGEKINYNLSVVGGQVAIEVKLDVKNQNIYVDYEINLRKLKPSITFHQNANQLFILPENSIFPGNHIKPIPDSIDYTVKVYTFDRQYSYAKQTAAGVASMPPTIIYGNFRIEEFNGIKVFLPIDINVNPNAIEYATSCVLNSYNYYKKVFGGSQLSEDFNLFFLNRRGGYTLKDGIILSQKYIIGDTVAREDLMRLISHEIAHMWWGIGVRTKSWSIAEGLAELSSDLYLIENEKKDSKDIYSYKNGIVLDSNIKPKDFEELSLFDVNYRAFAYNKLPIIFHEAELKIGRANLKNSLSAFYSEKQKLDKLVGFEDIVSYFPESYQTELRRDVNGSLEDWPDYYVKDVSGKTVVFSGENVIFPETVPVKLTTDNNSLIYDTLYFDVATHEVVKQYDKNIVKIIIDSDFTTNQSLLLNDLWTKDSNIILENKWGFIYPVKYEEFYNSLMKYLFTDYDVHVDDRIDKNNKLLLSAAKNKLKNINICGSFFIIRKTKKNFKIIVTFKTKDVFKTGFIEGHFYERDNVLKLKSIERIKI